MTAGTGTDTRRVRRAGYGLGAAAAAATLLYFAPSSDAVRFVKVSLPVVAVLLVLALAGLLGARTGRSELFAVAGGIRLIASILQLVQFGGSTNWLGGERFYRRIPRRTQCWVLRTVVCRSRQPRVARSPQH